MSRTRIVFDTETTGLLKPVNANEKRQPYITEICCIKMDEDWNEIARVDTLIKPPVPIPEEITKITGIDDHLVRNAPAFIEVYDDLYDLFFGVKNVIGHNVEFDLNMVKWELFRHDLEFKFNWPKNHICTVEKSKHYFNKRLKLMQLHKHLLGVEFSEAHRAINDVKATIRCSMKMDQLGDISFI